MMRTVALLMMATVLFTAGCMSHPSTTAQAAQPHMRAALEHLHKARAHLVKAAPNKGGHRVKAIEAVDRAIAQVKRGIVYDRRH